MKSTLFIERWLLPCSLPISGIYSWAASRVCFPQFYFLTTITKPSQNCAFVLHWLLQISSKNGHAFAFPVTQESKSCFKPSVFVSVQHPTYKMCAYFACQSSLFSLQIQGNNHETLRGFFFPSVLFQHAGIPLAAKEDIPRLHSLHRQQAAELVCATDCIWTVRFSAVCF